MPYINDITGNRYSKVTVISYAYTKKRRAYWNCKCDCGTLFEARGYSLVEGNTKSCGCLRFETKNNLTHGMFGTVEYQTWGRMLQRCTNPNDRSYANYGGRGIKVRDEWRNFETFYVDMGPRPSELYSLDRINNDGDYCKENCKWSTKSEQAINRAPAYTHYEAKQAHKKQLARAYWRSKGFEIFEKPNKPSV